MESHQPSLYKEIDLLYVLNLFMGQHSCCEDMELQSWQLLVEKQLMSINEYDMAGCSSFPLVWSQDISSFLTLHYKALVYL